MMEPIPAYRVASGQFVIADLDGVKSLCLKAEREGKDHVNHFLVALEPLTDRRAMRLIYLDPEQALQPAQGYSLAFAAPGTEAEVEAGDALEADGTTWLKVFDDPASQRLYSYVDLATGQVRPRIQRRAHQRLDWRIERI